jgi:TPR repeat protein
MRWFRKAADAGNAQAMSYIGMLYYNGRGIPKNDAQAIAWYRKAAARGDEGAQNALQHLGVK